MFESQLILLLFLIMYRECALNNMTRCVETACIMGGAELSLLIVGGGVEGGGGGGGGGA
jgi:hypothetical protein